MADITVNVQAPGAAEAARAIRQTADATRDLAKAEDEHIAKLKSSEERLRNFDNIQRKLAEGSRRQAMALREEARARLEGVFAIEKEKMAHMYGGSGGGGGGGGGGITHLLRTAANRVAPGLGSAVGLLGAGGAAVVTIAAAYKLWATLSDRHAEEARQTVEAQQSLRHAIRDGEKAFRAASAAQLGTDDKSLRTITARGGRDDDALLQDRKLRVPGAAGAIAQTIGMNKPDREIAFEAALGLRRLTGGGLDAAMARVVHNGHLRGKDANSIIAREYRRDNRGYKSGAGGIPGMLENIGASDMRYDARDEVAGNVEQYTRTPIAAEGAEYGARANMAALKNPGSAAQVEAFAAHTEKMQAMGAMLKASSLFVAAIRDLTTAEGSSFTQYNKALQEPIGAGR